MYRSLLFLSVLSLACATAFAASPAWPTAPAPVASLVAEADRSNLALAGESLEVERAAARLEEARSHFLPRVDLAARYSRADGGRSLDFPVGDLLNGAYATLNQYLASQGQPARFPTLSNQSIPLLRDREQETKLKVVQPLYAPEISGGVRAAKSGLAARNSQLAAFRRQLRADVQEAYFRYQQAATAVEIHTSALQLVRESLRVNRSLAAQDRITDDVVLRAEAEVSAVTQQTQEATRDRDLARSYLNFLLNRPLDTFIEPLPAEVSASYAGSLRQAGVDAADIAGREELSALQQAEDAARENTGAIDARRRPTVALAVEGGIQGESYGFGSGRNYTLGSLVMEWNLFDGHQRRSEVNQAKIEERQTARRLAETRQQFGLQLQQARDDFIVALTGLESARLRREAARAGYRLVARREAEGLANQITVLDARNTLTAAELNYVITEARLFTAAAHLDRAAALSPLP